MADVHGSEVAQPGGAGARSPGRRLPAASVNPQAGDHLVVGDHRELAAALRAGERTWQRFPYYEQRYGERGKRFTASDSGWIATLPDHAQASVDRQVLWLAGVLAARGMPRWLLEVHLGHLHEELVAAVPERRPDYDKLLVAADVLRRGREAAISVEHCEAIAASFDARVGPELAARLPEAGRLIVAALADELAGVARAVESLESWLTDPERFPPAWAAAVRATIVEARGTADPGS